MGGSNVPYQKGSYGIKGVSSSSNVPGARDGAFAFTDASNNFWLFGGGAYAASGPNSFNDLWKYSPVTNQWTWISGDTIPNQSGIYGVQGQASIVNKPGARGADGAAS